jgi:hypothetical protein
MSQDGQRETLRWIRIRRLLDVLTSMATVATAGLLFVAYLAYSDQERSGRYLRSLELIKLLNTGESEDDRKKLLTQFKDRWKKQITSAVSAEDAQSLLKASVDPEDAAYDKWNTARKHINRLEESAFAYVHDLGDRQILAASVCISMAKSYCYFKTVIDAFGCEFGEEKHPWQLIPLALNKMEAEHGPECGKTSSSGASARGGQQQCPRTLVCPKTSG